MNWSVDESLYNWLKILSLKCKNISEVEYATLPDTRKCYTLLR